jgi:hypothetical protein
MTCRSMPMPTASKDRLLLRTEASSHRYCDSTILRSTCSSQNPQTSAAQSPPGQMLGGSATGTTTRGRVGLDHHNLASQSVFEPSFDLTVARKSSSTRCALKHLSGHRTQQRLHVHSGSPCIKGCSGFARRLFDEFNNCCWMPKVCASSLDIAHV